MPYVLKTCLHANVHCVLTCPRANVFVLTCSRTNVFRMLTCSRANLLCMLWCSCANVPWVLTYLTYQPALRLMYLTVDLAGELMCSCANMPWVPYLTRLDWQRDYLPTCLASISSFDAVFFQFNCHCCWGLYAVLVRFKSLNI